jgi:hypothetical protein
MQKYFSDRDHFYPRNKAEIAYYNSIYGELKKSITDFNNLLNSNVENQYGYTLRDRLNNHINYCIAHKKYFQESWDKTGEAFVPFDYVEKLINSIICISNAYIKIKNFDVNIHPLEV